VKLLQSTIVRTGLLGLVLLLPTAARADEAVEKIFAEARRLNPSLSDYCADMTLRLDANLGFINYRPEMKGQYLFKKPNKHKLDIPKAPSYLRKYPSVFGFNLPVLKNFDSKVVDEVVVEGSPCYHIHLLNKVTANNDIEHLEIYIDKKNHTVPRYDTYYNGGHLFVTSKYRQQENYWVFERMTANYKASSVSVQASADYSNYKFNQKLPDSLFGSMPTAARSGGSSSPGPASKSKE
jgi:outer membrane lipoprotein-sorting protein